MSAFDFQALDATTTRLVAILDRHRTSTEALVRDWPDMAHYQVVGEQVEEIRQHCAGLPTLSVQFVGLLIAHAELVHSLWSATKSPAARDLATPLGQHATALVELRAKALRLLSPAAP